MENKNLRRDEVDTQNANGNPPDVKEDQTNKEKTPERNNTDDDNIGNDVTIGEEEITIGEEEIIIGEEEFFDNEDIIDDDIDDGPIYY